MVEKIHALTGGAALVEAKSGVFYRRDQGRITAG